MVSEWPLKYMCHERKYMLVILSTETIFQNIIDFKGMFENET